MRKALTFFTVAYGFISGMCAIGLYVAWEHTTLNKFNFSLIPRTPFDAFMVFSALIGLPICIILFIYLWRTTKIDR